MSYSRWTSSVWYTYYNSAVIDGEPTFTACTVGTWKYSDIKNNRQQIFENISKTIQENKLKKSQAAADADWMTDIFEITEDFSEEEYAELSTYMDKFCAQVEAENKIK